MLPIRLTRYANLIVALALAGAVGGCFRPLYGDQSTAGRSGIFDKMRSVEVDPVKTGVGSRQARVGGEVRNELIYQLTGGGTANTTEYRLAISMSGGNNAVISDIASGRSETSLYGITASYTLVDTSTGKQVLAGNTFARASYELPGQQQRFAGERALRNAENQAAKNIAENIRTRLASYFATGIP